VLHVDRDHYAAVLAPVALAAAVQSGVLKYHEIPGGGDDAPLATPFLQEGLDWVLGGMPSC
jgi:hypothetical protein